MGQGAIKWENKLMLNCRESYLGVIGSRLRAYISSGASEKTIALADHWNQEVETMPPGCVTIDLESYLVSEDLKRELLSFLNDLYADLSDDMTGTKLLTRNIIQLLELGFDSLDEIYKGDQA
jgi:hypothetical protein